MYVKAIDMDVMKDARFLRDPEEEAEPVNTWKSMPKRVLTSLF